MKTVLLYIIPSLLFAVLDGLWFQIFMKKFAIQKLQPILRMSNESIHVRPLWALTAYALMVLIAVFFLHPRVVIAPTLLQALAFGFLMGICVFGVFDATNGALLKVYPSIFIIVDTLWGGIMYALVALTYYFLARGT